MFASVGNAFVNMHKNDALPCGTDYPGKFVFDFACAVSGWWIGRQKESIVLFNKLLTNEVMPEEYVNACLFNLQKIGA